MKKEQEKGIISIIAVLSIGIFIMGTSLVLAKGTLQRTVINRSNVSTYQAFYAAESAMNNGVYNFVNNPSYRDTTDTLSDVNDLDANIIVGNLHNGYATVIGNASNNKVYRKTIATLCNFPQETEFVFDYGIYTPQIIDMNGSVFVDANVFASEEFYCKGKIDNTKCEGSITGEIIEYQSYDVPTFNQEVYYNLAVSTNTYFENAGNAKNYIEGSPASNVVVYVENSNRMLVGKNNTNFTGSLWVTGDLKITGGTYTAPEGFLAIMVEGDLEIAGNATINGIVYVKGTTEIGAGGATINGSLISIGSVNILGNLTVNYEPNILNIWQQLVGLEENDLYDTNFQPQISNWNEE